MRSARSLTVILKCVDRDIPRVRYVLDSFLLSLGIPVMYASSPPDEGPWLLYAEKAADSKNKRGCLHVAYDPSIWSVVTNTMRSDPRSATDCFSSSISVTPATEGVSIDCDLLAQGFWYLASIGERRDAPQKSTRGLYSESPNRKKGTPQDVVDRYLEIFRTAIESCCRRSNATPWLRSTNPAGTEYSVVLSHDIDFIPANRFDVIRQGVKTIGRHLVREGSPVEAVRAGYGLTRALFEGRDPYGCLPEMIAREMSMGVKASYQVAVGHRHPVDVNYFIEDDRTRNYLRVITDNDFELCLHGSYRSTENPDWYREEVELLTDRLGRPIGSRQHFLSFDYDTLFSIQESSGIRYDMSMGYADQTGPRAGFSFPYFPWNIREDRPYDVLQIPLFLMDVTLRSYLGLRSEEAWKTIKGTLDTVRRKRGAVSVVWHPIVFGNARDPGYGDLFWRLVDYVESTNGLATDGRTVNECWRRRASSYPSFSGFG